MISRESRKQASPDQSDMFGGPPQPDLFGAPADKAYVPDPRHVRNRLENLLAQMRAADTWPWEPVIVRLHRDRNLPYLWGLLPDEEAAEWRRCFHAELARLERAGASVSL